MFDISNIDYDLMKEFVLDDSIGYNFNIVANLLKRELNEQLRRENIDVMAEQWALLFRLHERGSMNQQDLAVATSRDNASITRSLIVLEKKQLIQRQFGQDRRNHYLSLTPAGEELVPRLIACAKKGLDRATRGMEPEELAVLNKLTLKIAANLKN
ncbi:MarR family transcriptional regulator [Dyadobacter chenwenxiniae]|uniref:MarR family transcriptional regulator n=1 Tax=Dyadobacter chenwenxiniae TaxID=2906456 RepID=A0A9X1PGW9_9BACT|nr:MarR family transcriptional regulator [Dyadobacter chenwenxiniae]MCF0060406.1 MarR family transcriptional regulator [Dyadobacter chenwenxiniae]UON86137.1 MarR family transcriptional regulator [Dyadobacter chenwenxiniae]